MHQLVGLEIFCQGLFTCAFVMSRIGKEKVDKSRKMYNISKLNFVDW